MFYTANPELDAARHEDAMEAAQEATAHEYQQVAADIRYLFTELVMTAPLMRLTAPQLRSTGSGILPVPIIEAIDDSLTYSKPHDALMAVIAQSQCPLVAHLREALAQHWIDHHAQDLAGV
ncbi:MULTISPECIES: hypothetical protein [Giesbergeria]|uniref:Uncharacterized protein n=1 Tax=Giesbergeria sinuosa TaxID=80883 RepID=A0ABV9QBD7_9BURK